ncbi:MAG: Ig-like domain-containing protein, partial [Verrucomicrobia bacterium]|nr:Ig-like domain-containing protein [Verrucomicrobiota bacterium]
NDTYTTPEDVPLIIPAAGVLTNDPDGDGDALTALLLTNVSNGSLTLDPNGAFTYIPNPNYYGSDSFTYRASDGWEPVPVVAILQQNNSGGDKLEIKDISPGAQSFRHGSAGGPAYSVSKVRLRLSRKSSTPNVNLNFSIGTGKNSDPIAGSTFAITRASITNTSGGTSFQDYEIAYAAPVGPFTAGTTYYLNLDFAPTGKEVWIEMSGNAYANGTYYEAGSNLGKDMRFQIHGFPHSDIATVTLTVTPVNDAPLANDDSTNTLEDVSVTIPVLANDSDVEGSPLTLTGASTTNGTAIISGTKIVFTPATNFSGLAVFTYTVSDGVNASTGNVTVVVSPVNDASPVAVNDTYTTPEDVPLTIAAPGVLSNDTDVDGDALTAALVSNVSNGSLSLNPDGSFTYTPSPDYFGSDSFAYRVSDGLAPVVAMLQQNTSGANKIEVKKGKYGAQSFRHGIAGGASYTISKIVLYVSREPALPAANPAFNIGTGLNSGALAGSSVTIPAASITNTTSGASFQTYEIAYPTPVGPFTAGTTYYLNVANPTDKRFFVETSSSDTYPNGTYYDDGAIQTKDLRFQVFGSPISDIATVTLTVTPVNDAPLANNDSTNTPEDVSMTIPVLANDSDVEGTPLTITSTSTTNGTATISGNDVIFTPSANFNGIVVFDYTISDGTDSATASVTVTVTPVNDAPVANNDTYTTPEDVMLTVSIVGLLSNGTPSAGILANDTDADGDALTALLVSNVSHGSLALNPDGSFTYTPISNYFGSDSFTYRAYDGSATSAVATVSLTILDNTPLSFSSAGMTADGFELHLSGPMVSTYVILASTNMLDWTPISTNSALTGSVVFTDTEAKNFSQRYYRATAL